MTLQQRTKVVEWPPSFEKDGSSFVFDVRSAMFYESLSDFFYDPKSKLYYGNRTGSYFRYDETQDPPFVKVETTATTTTTNPTTVEGACVEGALDQVIMMPTSKKSATATMSTLPKIAIKLKTKKIKSRTSSHDRKQDEGTTDPSVAAAGPPSVPVSKAQKEQIANIEKWTGKQAELNEGIISSSAAATVGGSNSSTAVADMEPTAMGQQPSEKVRTTAKGEPICIICKRKFPTIEKLRLHERASDLHKKNLVALQQEKQRTAKRKVEEVVPKDESATPTAAATAVGNVSSESNGNNTNAGTSTSTTQYQDRAEKRRQLHGPDSSLAMAGARTFGLPPSVGYTGFDEIEGPAISSSGLDESNVGHKMMQKMGYNDNAKDVANDPLRREWDRIEALASHRQGPRGGGNSSHYGPKHQPSL
jgi:hypothetical protein